MDHSIHSQLEHCACVCSQLQGSTIIISVALHKQQFLHQNIKSTALTRRLGIQHFEQQCVNKIYIGYSAQTLIHVDLSHTQGVTEQQLCWYKMVNNTQPFLSWPSLTCCGLSRRLERADYTKPAFQLKRFIHHTSHSHSKSSFKSFMLELNNQLSYTKGRLTVFAFIVECDGLQKVKEKYYTSETMA